jgi:aminomethyltransferase
MRSHNVLVRRLVGLSLQGDGLPARGAEIVAEGQPRGRITSSCLSPRLGGVLALGYLSTSHARPDTPVDVREGESTRAAQVVTLPLKN